MYSLPISTVSYFLTLPKAKHYNFSEELKKRSSENLNTLFGSGIHSLIQQKEPLIPSSVYEFASADRKLSVSIPAHMAICARNFIASCLSEEGGDINDVVWEVPLRYKLPFLENGEEVYLSGRIDGIFNGIIEIKTTFNSPNPYKYLRSFQGEAYMRILGIEKIDYFLLKFSKKELTCAYRFTNFVSLSIDSIIDNAYLFFSFLKSFDCLTFFYKLPYG